MDLERLDFTEEPLLEKEEVDEEEQRFPSRRSKNIFRDHFHSNNNDDDDDDDDEGAENDGIKRRLCSLPARYRWTAAGFWLAVTVGVLGTLFVILSVVSLLAMKHYNPVAAGTLKTANISINSDNTATGTSGLILDTISHWHTVDIQSVRCSISFSPHRSSQITKQQAIAEQLFVGYLTVTDVGKLATGGLFTRGAAAFHRQPSFAFTDVQTANLELARQSVLKGEDLVYANCVIDLTVDAWGFISFSMPYYYHHFIGKHLYHITKPVVDGTSITAQPPQAPSHHGHHHSSPHIDFTDLSKSALEIEVPLKVKVPLPSSVTSFVIDLPPTWFEAVSKPCGSSKHANQNRPDLVIASNPISFDLVQHQQGKLDLLPTIHLACSRNALLQAQQQQQNQNDDSSSDDNNNNNGGEAESCSLLGFLREIGGQVVQSECTHIDITTPTPNLLTWVVNPQHNVTLEKSVVVNQSTSIEFHLDIVLDQRYAVASDFLIYPDDQYAAGDLSYLDMHSADNQTSFGAANVTWSLEHGFSSQVGYNISIMDFGVLGTANIDVNTDTQTLAIAIAQIHNNEPLLTANLAGSWTAGAEDNGPITASMQGDAVWSGSTPFNVDFTGGLNIDTNTSTYDLTLSGLYNSSNTFATVGGSIFASFAEYWQPFSMIVGAAAHFNDTQLFLLNITAAQSPNYDGFSTNSTFYLYLSDSLNIGAQVKFASQEDAYSLLVEADKNSSPIFSLTSAGQLINDYDMFSLYGEANAFLTNLDQTALLWNVSSTLDIQVGNDNLLAQLIALNNATNLLTVSLAGGFNFDDGFALNSSLFIEWGDNDFVLDSPLIVELSGTSKEYLLSYQLTENGNLLLDLASSGSYADAEDFFSAQTDLLLYSAPTLFDFNIYGNASVSLAYGSNNTADFNLNALLSSSDETLFSLSVEGKYSNSEIDSTNTIQASVLAQVGSDNTLTSNLSIINNYDNSSTTLSFTGYLNDDGFNLQSNSYQTVVYNENDSETTSTYSTNSLAWTATNPFTATFDYVNQEIRSFETGASDHFITLGSTLIYNDTTTQLFELLWQGASSPISGNASLSWDFFSATGNVVANYNFADDFSLYFDAQTGQETLLTVAVDGQFDDAEESWNCDGSLSWLPENPNEFIFTFSTAGSFSNDTLSALLQAEYILNSSEVTNALIAQLQMDSSELTFSLEAGQHLTANVRVITAPITGDNNTGGITFDSVVSLVWNATDSPFTFLGNCSGFLAFTDESSEINAAAQVQLITRDISPIYSGTLVFTVTNDTITVQSAFARDQEPPVLVIDYILIFGLPDADHDIFSSVSTTAQLNWNGNGAFELTIHASGEYDSQDDHGFTVNGAAGFAFQPVSNSSSSSGLSIDGDFGLEYNRQSSSVTFQMEGDMNDEQKFALNVLATRSNTTGDDFEASVAATLKVGSNIAVAATLDASLYNQTAALRLTASNQNGDGLTLQLSGSLQRAEVQGDNTVFNGATSLSWVGDSPFTFNGTVLLTFSHEPSSATSFLLDVTGLLSADSTHNVNLHTEGRFTQLESLYQLSANASLALTDNIFQGFLTANYDTSSTSGSLGLTGASNDEGLFNLQAVASFLSDDPIIALQTAASVSFSSSSTSFEYSGELGFTYDREQHILNLTATSPNLLEFNGLFQYELEDGFSASLRTYLFWNSTDSLTFLVSALVDYDSAAQSLNLQLTAASATETYCRLIVGGSYTSEPLIGVQGNMNFSASNFLIEGTFDFELDIDAKNVSLTLTSITNFDSEVTTVGADFSGSWTSLSDSGFLLTLQGELDITSDSSTKGTFSGRLSFDPDQQSVSASALLSFADAESSQQLTTTLQVGWVLSNGTSPFTTTAEITAQLEGTEDSHFADLKATAVIGNNNFDISATVTLNDPNPSYEAALQGNWLLLDDSFSLSFKANANQAAGFVLSTTGSFSVDWNEKQLSAGLTALFSAPDYEPFSLDANVTGFWYGTFKGGFEADFDGTVRVRDDIWLPFFEVSYSPRRAVEFNFGVNDPQETAFDLSLLLEFDDLDLSGDFSLVWPGLQLEIISDFTIEASTTTGSYWHTGNADLQGFAQWTIGETAGGVYLNGNAGYTTVDFDDGSLSGDWAVSANYGIARQFGESVAGETTVASTYSFGNGLFLSLDSDSYLTVDESALYALSLSSALGQPEGISVLFEMTIDQPIVFALNGNYEYDSHPFTIGYSAEMQLLENGQSTLVATSNTKAELHHDKLKANSLTQCVGSSGQVLFNLDAALNGDLAQNLVEAIALLTIAEETLFEADSLTFWTTENGFAVQTYTTASIPNDVVTLSGVLDFNEIDTTVFGNLALALNSRDLLSGRVLAFWDFLDWPQTTAQLSGLASFTWSGFNEYNYDLLSVSAGGEVTVAQWSATTSLALRSSTYWDNWEAYVTGLASLDDLSPQGTFQVEVFSNEELLWHGLETFSLDLNPEAGTLALLSTAQVNGMNLLVVSGQSSWTLNSVSGFQAQLLGSLEYTPPSDNGDYDGDGSLTVDVAGSVSLLSPFSLHGTVKVNSHQYLEVDATATWQFECFDEEVCFSASGTAGFNWTPQDSYDDVIFSASGLVNFGNQQLTVSITQKQNQKTYLQGGLGASWDRLSGLSGRGNAWLAWADLWNVRGTANIDVNTLSNTMLAQATGSYNNFQYISIGSSGSWSTGNGISAQGTAYLNWNGPEAPFSLAGSANFDLTQPRNSLQVSATGKYNGQQYLSIGASLSGGNDFSFPLQGSGNLAWQGSHPFSVGTAFYLDVESDQSFDFRTSGSWNGIQYVVVETSGNWLFNDQTKVGGSASLQWNGSEDSNPLQVGGSFNFQLDPSADTFALSLSGQFDNNDEFSLNTQGSWGTTNGFSTQASGTFSWNGNDPFVVGGTTSFAFSSPSNTASLSATGQWNQVQYVALNTRGNYSGETGFFVSATGSFDWTGETPFTTSSMLSANVDTTQDSYDVSTSLSYNTRSIYIGTSGSWQDV